MYHLRQQTMVLEMNEFAQKFLRVSHPYLLVKHMNIDIYEIRMMINTKEIAIEKNHYFRTILYNINHYDMCRVDVKLIVEYRIKLQNSWILL